VPDVQLAAAMRSISVAPRTAGGWVASGVDHVSGSATDLCAAGEESSGKIERTYRLSPRSTAILLLAE